MITPRWKAIAKDGKLSMVEQEKYDMYLCTLDGEVYVSVSKQKDSRSQHQNRYYWGVVLKLISEETGYSQDECHELCKHLFLKNWVTINKQVIDTTKSTTSLSTTEMENYLSEVRQWASVELSCYIPLPNEVDYE